MPVAESALTPADGQGLDIRPTPREEMNLYPLDTFPYEYAGREITISFEMPEFTAICPFSDFPDFAIIRLSYVPDDLCVELKSLKLYINSFRNIKIFHEHVINVILEDFVKACAPLRVELEGDFHVRGNIKTIVRAKYEKQEAGAGGRRQEQEAGTGSRRQTAGSRRQEADGGRQETL